MKPFTGACMILFLLNSACTPVAQVAPIPVVEHPTRPPTATPTPAPTATLTASVTPANTATLIQPLSSIRKTPPTLMLHRPNLQFDSLAFLKEFVVILKQNDMKVVTYRDISEHPEITATEQGKLFIITLDDIYLAYPMDKRVVEMIRVLKQAGYPAVLGVVTETDHHYPETVERLKELSGLGWEIASHTDHHANLGNLEKASAKLVAQEVSPSLDKIEKAIGIRPITLILPDGQMVNNIEILRAMGLYWIVGINGGITYDSHAGILYVGREGPGKDAEATFKTMKVRFGF